MDLDLKPGHTVEFHGLKGAAHLNGTTGHLVKFHKEDQRWAVRCDKDAQVVKTKAGNLKKWFQTDRLKPHKKDKGRYKESTNGVADPQIDTFLKDGELDPDMMNCSPDMIIYPADPLTLENCEEHEGYGVVSHNFGCNLAMIIFAERLRKHFSSFAEEKNDHVMRQLLAVFGIEPQVGEDDRDEAMAAKHGKVIQANLQNLERQACTGEYKNLAKEGCPPAYFLFFPLQRFFQHSQHDFIEMLLGKYGFSQKFVNMVMKGYRDASVRIHMHGEASYDDDGRMIRPPDEDLIGPIAFGNGLRQQCPMTPLLALIHIHSLLQVVSNMTRTTLFEVKDIYIFPHALVISAENPGHLCDLITHFSKVVESFGTPSCVSQLQWARSSVGKEKNKDVVTNESIIRKTDTEHVSISKMIDTVCLEGTNQYPFFSAENGIDVDTMMHMAWMKKIASSEDENEEDAVK